MFTFSRVFSAPDDAAFCAATVTPSTPGTAATEAWYAVASAAEALPTSTRIGRMPAPVKSAASRSETTRLWVPGGNIRSSIPPKCTLANGALSTPSSTTMPISTGTGRRITPCAMRPQRPFSDEPAAANPATVPVRVGIRFRRDQGSRPASTLGPSTASSAGSTVRLDSMATSTAAAPPRPIECSSTCGKIIKLDSANATSTPETATVRPAVAIVRETASGADRPRSSSSRNRLTMNSP